MKQKLILKTEYIGRTIESGLLGGGFWAKCGTLYEGGHRSEATAIRRIKNQINRSIRANTKSFLVVSARDFQDK